MWFRRRWEPPLLLLDEWWFWCTEYANWEGQRELPSDFYNLNRNVLAELSRVSKRDLWQLREVGELIIRHAGIRQLGGSDPHVSISDIVNAVYRAKEMRHQLWADGTTKQQPRSVGRPKDATTVAIENALRRGESVDQLSARYSKGADAIRKIGSRMRQSET